MDSREWNTTDALLVFGKIFRKTKSISTFDVCVCVRVRRIETNNNNNKKSVFIASGVHTYYTSIMIFAILALRRRYSSFVLLVWLLQ